MIRENMTYIILFIFIALSYLYNKIFLRSTYKNIYIMYLVVGSLSVLIHLLESLIYRDVFTFQYGANMLDEIVDALLFTFGIFLLNWVINAIINHFCRESDFEKGFLYSICVFIQVFTVLFFLYSLYGFIATNVFNRFTFEIFINSPTTIF
jgi:hypothetical protein